MPPPNTLSAAWLAAREAHHAETTAALAEWAALHELAEALRHAPRDAARGEAELEAPERVTIDDALLRDAFREAVSETLLYIESQRVQVAPPTQPMIDAEWRRFFQAVGGASRLERVRRALAAREQDITDIVEQRAWIASFLEANLRGSEDVDIDTVERVFASGEHPFTSMTLEEAREPLRAFLGGVLPLGWTIAALVLIDELIRTSQSLPQGTPAAVDCAQSERWLILAIGTLIAMVEQLLGEEPRGLKGILTALFFYSAYTCWRRYRRALRTEVAPKD